jgi:DNA polymerase III epsilon subunit-like protein
MNQVIIFDCEWLTDNGAWERSNCGPYDPDPQIVQLGAIRIALNPELTILQQFNQYVRPRTRTGEQHVIPEFFSEFTGITKEKIAKDGKNFSEVIDDFLSFSNQADCFWSWGKDELAIAKSCYLSKLTFPIAPDLFGNISKIFLKAVMPLSDILKTNSGRLAQYYGLSLNNHNEHNALCDVLSIHASLKHLSDLGKLDSNWLEKPV